MNEPGEKKFSLKGDSEPTDLYREEMIDLRVEKLGHRMTLLAVLMPILIGVVLVIVYLDIKNRVSTFHVSGTTGVANLSKDLESRFSSLSLRLAKLEETTSGSQTAMEKSLIGVQAELKTIRDNLDKTRNQLAAQVASLGKADRNLTAALKTLDRKIDPVAQETATLKKDLEALDTETAQALDLISQSLKKAETRIEAATAEIADLADSKIGQKELELALNSQKQVMGQELDVIKTGLQAKILSLEKQIDALGVKVNQTSKTLSAMPPAPAPKAADASTSSTPPKSTPAPTPKPATKPSGETRIIEQDIQE